MLGQHTEDPHMNGAAPLVHNIPHPLSVRITASAVKGTEQITL